ncbi:MAG TPA: HD domain-containing protein [Candidatus Atribacteria bacterium]|nr:HD domain-containing protein [Candidatus Atribacteria bacterium]
MRKKIEIQEEKRTIDPMISSNLINIINSLPFYVMLVDEDHHILLANHAVKKIFSGDPDQLIGEYCPKAMHGLDGPFAGCPLEESVKKGCAVEREFIEPKSGRWVSSGIYPTGLKTSNHRAVFFHMTHDITERKQAQEKLLSSYQTQAVLSKLLNISLLDISLEKQLQLILDHIMSIPWLELKSKGSIFLVEDNPGFLVMKAHYGFSPQLLKTCKEISFGHCLCGRAASSGQVEFADCVDSRHENQYQGMSPHGHYCVPIRTAGKVVGVINMYIEEKHKQNKKEEEFLCAVADVLAGIIKRQRSEDEIKQNLRDLRQAMEGSVELTTLMVEAKDPYTAGHQRQVSILSCAIAQEMNLSEEQIEGTKIAGLIHDLGKISIPSEILSKPGRITDLEFNLIKNHPQIGYDILKTTQFPWPIKEIVLQHHERMNGSGYPSGLSGESILIEARILGVADVVEAMSSHRPYRPALGIDKALEEISQNKGTLYDPQVVDACLKLFRKKGFTFK